MGTYIDNISDSNLIENHLNHFASDERGRSRKGHSIIIINHYLYSKWGTQQQLSQGILTRLSQLTSSKGRSQR